MCMCGDFRCWSCGPAQGNNQCPICYRWDDDGGCQDRAACLKVMDEEDARMCIEDIRKELMRRWTVGDTKACTEEGT